MIKKVTTERYNIENMSRSIISALLALAFMVLVVVAYQYTRGHFDGDEPNRSGMRLVRENINTPRAEDPVAGSRLNEFFREAPTPATEASIEDMKKTEVADSITYRVAGTPYDHFVAQKAYVLEQGYTITNEYESDGLYTLYGVKEGSEVSVSSMQGDGEGVTMLSMSTRIVNQ